MADDVATVSSRPALGFAAVVISDQSYSGRTLDRRCRRLVDEADGKPDEQEFTELTSRIRQGHLLSDAHRAVVRTGDVEAHQQREYDAEFQAFSGGAAALVSFGENPGLHQHRREDPDEHEREAARVAGTAIDLRISRELAVEHHAPHDDAVDSIDDGGHVLRKHTPSLI